MQTISIIENSIDENKKLKTVCFPVSMFTVQIKTERQTWIHGNLERKQSNNFIYTARKLEKTIISRINEIFRLEKMVHGNKDKVSQGMKENRNDDKKSLKKWKDLRHETEIHQNWSDDKRIVHSWCWSYTDMNERYIFHEGIPWIRLEKQKNISPVCIYRHESNISMRASGGYVKEIKKQGNLPWRIKMSWFWGLEFGKAREDDEEDEAEAEDGDEDDATMEPMLLRPQKVREEAKAISFASLLRRCRRVCL